MLWMDLCPEAQRDEATAKAGYETLKSIAGGAIVSPAKAYPIHYDLGITLDELEAEPGQSVSLTFTLQSGDQLFYDAAGTRPVTATSEGTCVIDLTGETVMPELFYSAAMNPGNVSVSFSVDAFTVGDQVGVFAATQSIQTPGRTVAPVTEAAPFCFWLNNDNDTGDDESAEDLESGSDCDNNNTIDCLRDLEDFAGLEIQFSAPNSDKMDFFNNMLKSGALVVNFNWVSSSGSPDLRLFNSYGADHISSASSPRAIQTLANGAVTPIKTGAAQAISTAYWNDPLRAGRNAFLFEAISAGSGELVMEFRNASGTLLAQSGNLPMDLKPVEEMYQLWSVGHDNNSWPAGSASLKKGPTKIEMDTMGLDKDYILFVHGWRMQPWERESFAETAFKRLWWAGFKGRFGLFSWPTEWVDRNPYCLNIPIDLAHWNEITNMFELANYNRSEQKAYASALQLKSLMKELNVAHNSFRVIAHSMGNVVTSEALREAMISGEKVADTYVASQAATVADSYATGLSSSSIYLTVSAIPTANDMTENIYERYEENEEGEHPYYGGIGMGLSETMLNLYNPKDSALADRAWGLGQMMKPKVGYDYRPPQALFLAQWVKYTVFPIFEELEIPNDRHEIFAFIAEARSEALGRGGYGLGTNTNLNTLPHNFTDSDADHSAQFMGTIYQRMNYWKIAGGLQ
jgi:hypothetical protein